MRAPGYLIEREGRGSTSNGEERAGKEWDIIKDDFFVGETKGPKDL